MKNILCLIMLLTAFAAPGFKAFAQDNADKDRWMTEVMQYRNAYFTKELGLSPEQEKKFFPLYDEMQQQTGRIDEDVRTMERRLKEASDVSNLEYEKATETFYDARIKQAEIEKSFTAKFREVLTPKQLFELRGVERNFQRDIIRQHNRIRGQREMEQ